jgi:hypothetical protein
VKSVGFLIPTAPKFRRNPLVCTGQMSVIELADLAA